MKATVNNSANFVINNDMLNETKCLKYVSKPTMLEEIVNIQVALAKLNSNYTPRQYTEKNSKKELFEGYGRLVTIYKELSEKREAEIAKNVATCIKTADVLAEEARVKAEAEAAKKAEEEAMIAQLGTRPLSDLERRITEYIIGNIDEDGYLRRDIENIVDDLAFGAGIEVSEEEVFRLLKIIQEFEPAGVGARDLKECLLL